MIKKLIVLLLAFMLAFACMACDGNFDSVSSSSSSGSSNDSSGGSGNTDLPEVITNKTYRSYWMKQFDYKTMPIAAFNGAPLKFSDYTVSMITDDAHFKAIKQAGINTVYGLYERAEYYVDEVKTALSLCEKYDLSYVAIGNGLGSFTDLRLAETSLYNSLLKENPSALGGVIVKDEPNQKEFSKIAKSKDILRQLFGKKILYHSNLFPNYATNAQLYGSDNLPADYSYENYVENYCKTYNPQILSYDFYPIHTTYISPGYFENMSVIRKYAQKYEIPFWTYIQSSSFRSNVKVPDKNEIFWLVNTSLAYGAKGLQYFTYVDPISSGGEVFTGSPIDKNGNKTATYDYISEVNKFVGEIDEVLMCCFSKGIMIAGSTPCEIPAADVLTEYGALKQAGGDSVIVGCFDYKGKDAFYLINNSLTEQSDAVLTFNGNVTASVIKTTGKTDFSGQSYSTGLSAGEGVLIVLN